MVASVNLFQDHNKSFDIIFKTVECLKHKENSLLVIEDTENMTETLNYKAFSE